LPARVLERGGVLGVVNLLMLAGPLYMLQIYDRVLASRSVPTLVALTIFLVGAYAFQGLFDVIRARVWYGRQLCLIAISAPPCTPPWCGLPGRTGGRAKPISRCATSIRSAAS
jgi:hypothetical protein